MIKLKGWRSERTEIEIAEKDVIDSVIDNIRIKQALSNVDGIDKNRMYEIVEYHTSHSWTQKEDRGVATSSQKKALEVIDFLRKMTV